MKLLVAVAMLLVMAEYSHCKRHRFGETDMETEHVYAWSGGVKANGEVGIKYKDGLQFIKDGNVEWYSNSRTDKKETKKETAEQSTSSPTTSTPRPAKTYSYSRDTVNHFAYQGAPSPYVYESQPYGYDRSFLYDEFLPYGYDSLPSYKPQPRDSYVQSPQRNKPLEKRVIPLH